jgi:hypothetical protein
MDVYFSTVVRKARLEEGGELVHLDWTRKKILKRLPLSSPEPFFDDPNPRGNGRGGRGILKLDDHLFVATYHTIFIFDFDLRPCGAITNNLCVGLHELCKDQSYIWAASTAIDAVIKIDLNGRLIDSWWSRENDILKKRFGLEPAAIDKSQDNRIMWLSTTEQKGKSHTHLNAVRLHENELFVLLNRFGVVFNITSNRVVLEDANIIGGHNLLFVGDKLVINDSNGKKVIIYYKDGTFYDQINLLEYPELKSVYQMTLNTASRIKKPLFIRGISSIGDNRILIGFSPATIAEFDLHTKQLMGYFQYSKDVATCIHGLTHSR